MPPRNRDRGTPTLRRRAVLPAIGAGLVGSRLSGAALPTLAVVPAAAAEVLTYVGDAAFAPFESLDAQGRPQGFQIDLLTALGPLLGVEFAIRLQPWSEAEAAFRAGRADVIAMVDTPERRTWARFAREHATPALGLYFRTGEAEPQGLPDGPEHTIAVIDGDAMRGTLARRTEPNGAVILWLADARQALDAVQQGRATVALLPRAYGDPLLAAGGLAGVAASRRTLGLQPYAFAVAPGNEALQRRLEQGLGMLERDGRLEALRVQWLSSHRDIAEVARLEQGLALQREWMWGLGAVASAGLAMLGLGLRRRGRRVALAESQRQTAEAALQRAEALLDRAFHQAPDPMIVIDRDEGVVRDANPALASLLGVEPEALVGQPAAVLQAHVDGDDVLRDLVQTLDEAGALQAVPLRVTGAGGGARDCLVTAEPMSLGGGRQVFCVLRDVTEQLARDAALREGYDDLARRLAEARRDHVAALEGRERAEAALRDFTRTVVHDLRAPLTSVRGFVGLLRERLSAGHVQEALECGEYIDRAAQRMSTMVQALARLAAVGREPLRRQAVDMQRLASGTWELLAGPAGERRLQVRIDTLPAAQADPGLAAQVWQNLLDNAFKYTALSAQPQVAVDSFQDDRGTWYRVADNGVGFDMAQAGRLFQPFQRMHGAGRFEGSGIGLSLVRRIVDHHGGDVRIRSAPGVGTVVEFTLDAESPPG